MFSIKTRLVLLTMASFAAIFTISGFSIYHFARKNLVADFDQRLRVQAYSIMTSTYQKEDEQVEVHFNDRFLHEFNSNQKRAFYQIWENDDELVKRSESLGDKDLPKQFGKERQPKYCDLTLPNGLSGRAIGIRYEPRVRGGHEQDYNKGFKLILVVATEVREIRQSLARLRNLIFMGGGASLVLSPFFVFVVLRSGLSPLQGFAMQMGTVDADSLQVYFDEKTLPDELKPIARQLNALFLRLQDSFERERQFSADVSHELRTPIAAMLNIAEVGIKWKDGESKQDYEAIRNIAEEMQHTVTQLLDLSRADSDVLELHIESVAIEEVVRERWSRCQTMAKERNLTIKLGDFSGIMWDVDRSLFERIVENLLENAVNYSDEGGSIEIAMSEDKTTLNFRNSCEELSDSDIPKLFDRFWRKENSRTSNLHRGLGLAVASAFAKCLGLRLEAKLQNAHTFEVSVICLSVED